MNPEDLKKVPLFESLDKHDLERVARWTDDVDVEAGHHLVDEGAIAWEFFVILDGEAEVLRGGQHVTDLGHGDFFGEMALAAHQPRTASVIAKTPMRLAVMIERDFHDMEETLPHVAELIGNAIKERSQR